MFSENCGSTSLRTSWPSYSDHISPTVSSPTRMTTPPQVVHHGVDRPALVVPVLARVRQAQADGVALAGVRVDVRHDVARRVVVRHVVDAGAGVDQRLEHRVLGDVLDPLAVDPDVAAVADRVAVLVPGADHAATSMSGFTIHAGQYGPRRCIPQRDLPSPLHRSSQRKTRAARCLGRAAASRANPSQPVPACARPVTASQRPPSALALCPAPCRALCPAPRILPTAGCGSRSAAGRPA